MVAIKNRKKKLKFHPLIFKGTLSRVHQQGVLLMWSCAAETRVPVTHSYIHFTLNKKKFEEKD